LKNNSLKKIELQNKIPFFDIFCQIEKEYNIQLFFVGGFIRDLLLKKDSVDLDIVPFKMDYDKVARIIKYRIKGTAVTFKDNVRLIKNDLIIDVSKPRGESIQQDTSKRDFTINNLALDTNGTIYGQFSDIENKLIRSVYPENFVDDPLRMLRAFRFVSQLGFAIEKDTEKEIILKKSLISEIAVERIFDEIKKLITGHYFHKSLDLMIETAFIFEIIPELLKLKKVAANKYHFQNAFEHTITATKNAYKFTKLLNLNPNKSLILITTLLFHDLGKASEKFLNKTQYINHEYYSAEIAEKVLERLNYPNKIKEEVLYLIRNHGKIRTYATNNTKDNVLKKFIYKNNKYFEEHILVALADALSKNNDMTNIYKTIKRIRNLKKQMNFENTKLITGNDILTLGIEPGPIIKEILEDIHFKLTTNEINNKEQARKYIKNNYCRE
jgi:putative nucleotidyltransferase with HDIG domain